VALPNRAAMKVAVIASLRALMVIGTPSPRPAFR
jgi:hypothetical protein